VSCERVKAAWKPAGRKWRRPPPHD
jgi:hypothetical protein